MKRFAALALLLVVPAIVAACGGGSGSGSSGYGGSGSSTEIGAKAVSGGAVLVDSANRVLYTFSKGADCTGSCATVWRPLVADGDVVAKQGSQIDEKLLGTTTRGDGTVQATYDSQPLYYTDGSSPNMHDFGGTWDVVKLNLTPQQTTTGVSCDPNCGY